MFLSSIFTKATFAFSAVASVLYALPAVAQLGLSPLFIEEQAERGRAQGVITLTNSTDRPIRARVYSEPFTYNRDGFSSLPEDPKDLSPYLQFSPREMVIAPGDEQRVRLLGLFPPNLPPDEYRAAVFAEELADSSEPASPVSLKLQIGSMVYMRQGDVLPELVGIEAQPALNTQTGESVLELIVGNRGEASARASVHWQLFQAGTAVDEGTATTRTVVAERDRLFPLTLNQSLAPGSYALTGEMRWLSDDQSNVESFEVPVLVP